MASAWQMAGSACLDTSAQARRTSDAGRLCDYAPAAYCKGTVSRDGDGIRHQRSLVVAFASRELMAPDPGDGKVCIRRRPTKILRLYEKSLDKD